MTGGHSRLTAERTAVVSSFSSEVRCWATAYLIKTSAHIRAVLLPCRELPFVQGIPALKGTLAGGIYHLSG